MDPPISHAHRVLSPQPTVVEDCLGFENTVLASCDEKSSLAGPSQTPDDILVPPADTSIFPSESPDFLPFAGLYRLVEPMPVW